MGLRNFQFGWQICEKLNIHLKELAELCHAGRLAAYRFEDRHQVLASSQCNTKFKYLGNTVFTIAPSRDTGIIAISKKVTEDFRVYVDRRPNNSKKNNNNTHHTNNPTRAFLKASKEATAQRLKNIREMRIKFSDSEYIVYYNNLTARPLSRFAPGVEIIRLYENEQVFFELKEEEGEIDLNYLELNGYDNGGIKKSEIQLCIKREQDSFGNSKYILSDYDSNVVIVRCVDPFIRNTCKIFDDGYIQKKGDLYSQKYECWRSYIHQHSVDYFNKEDLSYSNPLNFEKDFFIFDYDEYKMRFHFFEDEEKVQKGFFNYIKNLTFDENEVKKVVSYEIAINAIKQDPQKYMIERCLELEEKYNDDVKNLKVIKAYHMAIAGSIWADIHKELWPERNQEEPYNVTFISRRVREFESIAKTNTLPFIKAKSLATMKDFERGLIVEEILKQLAIFHAKK